MGATTAALTGTRPSALGDVDFSLEREWLRQHRQEYIGQWVVLDGDRLVGHGQNPVPLFAQARAEGVRIPFVKFVKDESEAFCGAWL